MATETRALRDAFPRYHLFCDRCDSVVTYESGYTRSSFDTSAGSFQRCYCPTCSDAVRRMSRIRRQRADQRACVRHASRYSTDFARFIAEWYGIKPDRRLMEA